MITIKNFGNKVELKQCSDCQNITEVWTKEDIKCPALVRTRYKCDLDIKCSNGELIFINMSYLGDGFDKIYIEDDRIDPHIINDNFSIDIINYGNIAVTIPAGTNILEITKASVYNDMISQFYTNNIFTMGNISIFTNNIRQGISKFESIFDEEGKPLLKLNLNIPMA